MSSALVSYVIVTVLANAEAQKETEVKIGTMQRYLRLIKYSFWTFYRHFLAFT